MMKVEEGDDDDDELLKEGARELGGDVRGVASCGRYTRD